MISSQVLLSVMVSTAMLAAEGQKNNVRVVGVSDDRVHEIGEFGERDPTSSVLTVRVHADGGLLKEARSWGELVIAEAVDDLGNDLRREEGPLKKIKEFRPINPGSLEIDWRRPLGEAFANALEKKPQTGFNIAIGLKPPPRKANKIARLNGAFLVLAGGEERTIAIGKLKSKLGKAVSDPMLEQAGLKVTIREQDKGDEKALSVKIEGNVHTVTAKRIVDESGNDAAEGGSGGGGYTSWRQEFELHRPLDDSLVLRLTVLVDQKKVEVPFEFKDIVLP